MFVGIVIYSFWSFYFYCRELALYFAEVALEEHEYILM